MSVLHILEHITQLFIDNRQKAAEIISLEAAKPLLKSCIRGN